MATAVSTRRRVRPVESPREAREREEYRIVEEPCTDPDPEAVRAVLAWIRDRMR